MTYNIRHGSIPGGRVDLSALGEFCAELAPDILALQEVDKSSIRSGFADTEAILAEATGMTSVFGQAKRLGIGGRYGNLLLCRGELHEVEHVRLPRDARRERRGAIVAEVRLPEAGERVSVATTHLGVTRAEALRQLGYTLNALVRRPGPRILLGDLNLGPETVGPACLDAGLVMADPEQPTFPADEPEYRIDHVAVDGLEITSVSVWEGPVSDHRALVADVRPAPTPPVDSAADSA